MLGKLPESIGIGTYWLNRLRGRYSGLMEYKTAEPASRAGAAPAAEARAANGAPC